ncbi:hypothetical protein [Microbacterium paraoxydans]|uniref:Uncharacterized protein n=1 Tax=Microbacterium paraoxydans TaxID=199592 RepID=A0A1H1LBI0_9MICO|nr:hypothetical protein [Microbacterium paraoxydans]SDR71720.1 hypothetical protein SAMN04489809_0057 [Microbacterium paraoxydans]SDT09180.1 hypothetical protein SAMN04489809_3492 [Microbacterium paraoxydans]
MTIEEEYVRFVADADWTDECEVLARMRKRKMRLTPAQARAFAAELVEAAGNAESAANEAVRPVVAPAFDLLGALDVAIQREKDRAHVQVETIAVELGATVSHSAPVSPDCAAGKHPHGWQDTAWDDDADVEVPCTCSCHDTTEESAA